MQKQMPNDPPRKRLGPPPVQAMQNSPKREQRSPRSGLSKGEIAVGLGITCGFVVLGALYNLFVR